MRWLLGGDQDCPWLVFVPAKTFWAYFPEPRYQLLVLDSLKSLVQSLGAHLGKNTALILLGFQVETGVGNPMFDSFSPLQCERVECWASP